MAGIAKEREKGVNIMIEPRDTFSPYSGSRSIKSNADVLEKVRS